MLKETILALYTFLNAGGAPATTPDPAPLTKAVRVAAADPLEADDVVDRVQKFYDKTNRLTATFRQYYKNTTFGKTTKSDGKVYIKKPGKMVWDYYEKLAGKKKSEKIKSFVSDGEILWAVEHDSKQAFKKDLEKDLLPVAVTFLYGEGDLKRDFKAKITTKTKYGKKGEIVLELTPKKPSAQYKTLWLVVSPDNYRVRRSIVLEASGNTNAFTFYEPDLEKEIKDAWFVVNEKALKKAKYRIIQPDAEQAPKK
jgi:outer membrane lipoprotein carrier protein